MTHAIFKSLCAYIIIDLMKNNRDIRYCGGLRGIIPFVRVIFYVSILPNSMSFFGVGFYAKDLIMEVLYSSEIRVFLIFMILVSLSLTVIYSRYVYFIIYSLQKA